MKNQIRRFREELAKISKLSVSYTCHLENNTRRNPSYNTMVKIAKALNKEIGEVFKEL